MSKPRAPIATRLRNKANANKEHSLSQNEEASSRNEVKHTQMSSPPRDNSHEEPCPRNPKRIRSDSQTSSLTRSPSQESTTTKDDDSLSEASTPLEETFPFSPRTDPGIYLDELHSPLSFVRGTTEELDKFLREEQERLSNAFGNRYNSSIKISTFYQAQVSPPVPSKRTRHQSNQKTRSSKKRKL